MSRNQWYMATCLYIATCLGILFCAVSTTGGICVGALTLMVGYVGAKAK